jgi:PKD repeat protein
MRICVLVVLGALAMFSEAASAEWAEDNTCATGPNAIFPQPVSAFEGGAPWIPSTARFTYNAPYKTPRLSAFTALANFGDGTSTPATLAEVSSDCYEASAPNHTYASPGTYSFSYTVHDSTTQLDHALGARSIHMWNPIPQPLTAPGSRQIYPTVSTPWNGVVGEFTDEAPWVASFYRAEVEWEPGEPPAAATITGTHEHLIVSTSLSYWRPFTGVLNVVLRRENGALLGKWPTLSVSARELAGTRVLGRPLLALIGAGRYELVLRLDQRLPQTRSGHIGASIYAGGETRPIARFGRHRSHDCYAATLTSLAVSSTQSAAPSPFTLVIAGRTITQLEAHASLVAPGLQTLRRTAARQLGC